MADEITTFYSRTQEKCDTEANWEAANPILLKNEVIYIKTADGDTRTKTGDGTSHYKSLPFNDKNFRDSIPIKSLAGQKVKPTSDTEVTAGTGATIIGDTRARQYNGTGSTQGNIANGEYAIAIGTKCTASGWASTAIGYENNASGVHSIAIGGRTNYALGAWSISAGYMCRANGTNSVAMGRSNEALGLQFKIGKFSKGGTAGTETDTTGDAFIIGNGVLSSNGITCSNAFRVTYAGQVYGTAAYSSTGADYAEYFEWADGNPDNEDRRGRLVTLDGEKIRLATAKDDYILGVVSANPCVKGDVYSDDWQGKYLTDVFGQRLTKTVHIPDRYEEHKTIDPETGETKTEKILVEKEHDAIQWIINPDYDPDKEYVSREDRPEWAPVGMMGKLVVVDDGSCEVNGFCKAGINGIATKADNGYRVMKRIDETHILVLVR